jgi:hypothetical protein
MSVTYPHCDSLVLHAPTECRYCDRHPDWQHDREARGINFTGHNDPGKQPDPATVRRTQAVLEHSGEFANGYEVLSRWPGNVPQSLGEPLRTYFGDTPDSEYDDE